MHSLLKLARRVHLGSSSIELATEEGVSCIQDSVSQIHSCKEHGSQWRIKVSPKVLGMLSSVLNNNQRIIYHRIKSMGGGG